MKNEEVDLDGGGRMNRNFGALALLLGAVMGCSSAPIDEPPIAATGSELVVNTASRLDALPSPVAIHSAIVGETDGTYAAEWQRLTDLNYHTVSLTGVTLPGGTIRYSSVLQKNVNVDGSVSRRGMTDAQYETQLTNSYNQGFRVVDVVGHNTTSGMRYDGVWLHEITPRPGYYSFRNLSLATLQTKLTDLKAQGYRPIRLHGYATGSGTQYSGVWVKDALGTNYDVILDKKDSDYSTAFTQVTGNGFHCVDISAYPVGSEVRYTGVFIKDPTITAASAVRDLTLANFQTKQREMAKANYAMVDAEHYSTSTSSNVGRYAGVWIRRGNSNVVSNLDLSNLSAAGQTALTNLRNAIAGFQGKVGLVVEDVVSRDWIGININDPFYMASTTKVMIAAAVMDQVRVGALSLGQTVNYTDGDILETGGDLPTAAGPSTVEESLRFMLDFSSTNATDRLVRLVTAPVINRYLKDAGIIDVGEITSICELDKRIYEFSSPCVRNMTCSEFEQWSRSSVRPTSAAGQTCVDSITGSRVPGYEAYYSTLANSVTPLQYARFLRRLIEADIVTAEHSNVMFGMMNSDASPNLRSTLDTIVHDFADKSGSKYGARSLVGVGYNRDRARDGLIDDTAEYTYAIFTEDWGNTYDDTQSRTELGAIASHALTVLTSVPNHRTPPTPEPPAPITAEGFLEAASKDGISGWARDRSISGAISVAFYIDVQLAGAVVANLARPDVGAHGFSWVPPKFGYGPHSVQAFAIGVNDQGQPTGDNPVLAWSPRTYYEYDFIKPGDNGTASCSTFCEGPQWGEVGGCVGAVRSDTGERLTCSSVPGFLPYAQLTCECARGFIKPGNNGTVSCGTFCAGAQWGQVGRCVGATRSDTGEQLTCSTVLGLFGAQLTCQCIP